MDLSPQHNKYKLIVALFLSATAVVLVCLLGFVLALWDVMTGVILLVLTVLLTVTLWLMIRLDKHDNTSDMNEDESKPGQPSVASKKSEKVLAPEAAREWLDDFLVKQQTEDDLPASL